MNKKRLFKDSMLPPYLFWIPALSYSGLIFYMSSRTIEMKILSFFSIDKVIHLIEYAVLSFFYLLALLKNFPHKKNEVISKWAILLAICYGVSDEIHQSFVPTRQASVWDVLFDSLGALLGAKIYFWFSKLFKFSLKSQKN